MSLQPTAVSVPPRHALGLPAGSVRTLLTLLIVGLVCALMLLPSRNGPTPIPAYLLYLLFLVLGHYFAAHGQSMRAPGEAESSPLYLPIGIVRFLILLALGGTVGWKLFQDPEALTMQMEESVKSIQEQPLLPVVILGGFFVGVVFRWVVGHRKAYWVQDIQAWFALLATLGLVIAVLIHLVIDPSLSTRLEMPNWEGFLGVVVAFYFGERS